MARRPRLILPGQLHHILLRGNNDQPVFVDDEDRQAFRQILGEAARQQGATLHAWLLLPNRVHLPHPAHRGHILWRGLSFAQLQEAAEPAGERVQNYHEFRRHEGIQ